MRSLFMMLSLLFCCALAPAQGRWAEVELADGRLLTGRIVQEDVRQLVIETANGTETIAGDQVKRRRLIEAPAETQEPTAEPAAEPAPQDGATANEPARPFRFRTMRDPSHRRLLDLRLDGFFERFPWIEPVSVLQFCSYLITMLVVLALGMHMAASLAGAEGATMARAFALSLFGMLCAAGVMAFVPGDQLFLPIAGGVALVYLLVVRGSYRLSLGNAMVALLLFALEIGAGYGVLMVVDMTLRSIAHGPTY